MMSRVCWTWTDPAVVVSLSTEAVRASWWPEVRDTEYEDELHIPCEVPPGARPGVDWWARDALKVLACQNLLMRIVTYLRRRLTTGPYPNIKLSTVARALRMVIHLLRAQVALGGQAMDVGQGNGQGESEPPGIPALDTVLRAVVKREDAAAAMLGLRGRGAGVGGGMGLGAEGAVGRVVWDYRYMAKSLRYLLENLLSVMYMCICYREATGTLHRDLAMKDFHETVRRQDLRDVVDPDGSERDREVWKLVGLIQDRLGGSDPYQPNTGHAGVAGMLL
jgi:hypothetical protein